MLQILLPTTSSFYSRQPSQFCVPSHEFVFAPRRHTAALHSRQHQAAKELCAVQSYMLYYQRQATKNGIRSRAKNSLASNNNSIRIPGHLDCGGRKGGKRCFHANYPANGCC